MPECWPEILRNLNASVFSENEQKGSFRSFNVLPVDQRPLITLGLYYTDGSFKNVLMLAQLKTWKGVSRNDAQFI